MAKYSNSSFGDISGKVGNAVGSKWRSVKYMRGLTPRRGRAASALQLAQQAKFAIAAQQLSMIKDLLNLGFNDKKLNKITGYNAAVKIFLTTAIKGIYPAFEIDYPAIKMSKGSLNVADVDLKVAAGIELSWPADLNQFNSFADDKMVFIIYNVAKHTYHLNDSFTRSQLVSVIPFPGKAGEELHVWSFSVKRDGKTVSESQYVGAVTVPA